MLKLTKMAALLLAVSVPGVGLTPAAEVTVTWDGSAGTPYWNDPVPAADNGWGNWDGNPNPVNGDTVALDLGASDTKLKSDISGWPINWVDLWPSSGTVTPTIENGGHLQVDWEIRMYPHNGSTSQILIQDGTYQGRIENYVGSAGDIIPLITFPEGVTDNDIINLFPGSQWVYDDPLAILTVDNRGARLEIIFDPVSATVLLIR